MPFDVFIYSLSSCDTCKKSRKALKEKSISLTERDVRRDGIDPNDARQMVLQCGESVVNKRSTTWRSLDQASRQCDPVDLILEHTTLLKRPAICVDGVWQVGWPQSRFD